MKSSRSKSPKKSVTAKDLYQKKVKRKAKNDFKRMKRKEESTGPPTCMTNFRRCTFSLQEAATKYQRCVGGWSKRVALVCMGVSGPRTRASLTDFPVIHCAKDPRPPSGLQSNSRPSTR
jgi:hypothetical protein